MLFNSLEFALFLPVVFLLYWFIFNKYLKLQNAFILVISYVFYGWWDWRFLILISITAFSSYYSGIYIEKFSKKPKLSKAIHVYNIALNLIILGYFKYFNFFIQSFSEAAGSLGFHTDQIVLQIILPVGISFYTFQALSYSIDVYRGKIEATKDMVAFFAYISFFPQLVAGPIERSTKLLPQFYQPRQFEYGTAVNGMRQILWGLFKKVVVADNCAPVVNDIFQNSADVSGSTLLLGGILFSFQIYGDFSGYSDIALGTSRLFGFHLMKNFNYPYFSRDIAEFWRRWHISLSTWFRDYLYIPLGGSRGSKWQILRNVIIIFTVSGMWHGANWTFLVWGLYHGLLFVPLLLLGKNRQNTDIPAQGKYLPSAKELGQILLTFFLVLIGWIFFRADNIGHAIAYLANMFSTSLFNPIQLSSAVKLEAVIALASAMLLIAVEWQHRHKDFGLDWSTGTLPKPVRLLAYLVVIWGIIFFGGQQEQFIYFQF